MHVFLAVVVAGWLFVGVAPSAGAVPPPDFLFAVGSQLGIVFSFLLVIFSGTVGFLAAIGRKFLSRIRRPRFFWSLVAIVVVLTSLGIAWMVEERRQAAAMKDWMEDSSANQAADLSAAQEIIQLTGPFGSGASIAAGARHAAPDPAEAFIRRYYDDIGSGRFEEAYAVSTKEVPYEIFQGWYTDVIGATVESMQPVEDRVYALIVRIDESSATTRYAVLMTLRQPTDGGFVIARSDVKVLDQTVNSAAFVEGYVPPPSSSSVGVTSPIVVTNAQFREVIADEPFVLDAREDEEYAIGKFPGSIHIRFADLLAGEWIRIPADRPVYVVCWSGIRGREVAEFLRGKGIDARYLEQGALGWVEDGGQWEGGIRFRDRYSEERYRIVFTTEQMRQFAQEGVVLVDSRPQAKYERKHLSGSISIPVIYTPSVRMEESLAKVPPGSRVITICDDFVSCFDATVAGVKFQERGYEFLGRYNRPWEYN